MSKNEKIYIGVEENFVLDSTEELWLILSGEVNVFYTKINAEGKYLSALKLLYTAKKGQILFSLLTKESTGDVRLVLISDAATLLPIKMGDLLNIDHLFLKNMINSWIIKISTKLHHQPSPRTYQPLDNFEETELALGTAAYPSSNLYWINLMGGSIDIFSGYATLSAEDSHKFPVPISNKLWITARAPNTKIKILSTREVLSENTDFLAAIAHILSYFYKQLGKIIEIQESEERYYFQKKLEVEQSQLTKTLVHIQSIVAENSLAQAEDENPLKITATPSLLFSACKIIGRHTGFKIEEPKNLEYHHRNTTDQLFAIAKSSNLRVRKIILRGVWWKEENGDLLAFTKEGSVPVALIQHNSTTYILKNTETQAEVKVDHAIADGLQPVGYMFFSGFPSQMNSLKKVLSFALTGVKKDGKKLLLAAFAGSFIGLLIPILAGIMFDDVIPTADRSMHFQIFAIMIMVGFITAGLQLVQGILNLRVESKSSINLQAGVMDHILRLPVRFYKNYTAGDLTDRVLSINTIRHILSNTLITAVLSGAFSFVNLLLLFYYDAQLAWLGVLLAAIAVAFMISVGLLKLKQDRPISEATGEMQGFLFEFLSGMTKIRVTGAEKRIFTLWSERFSKIKKLAFRSGNYQNFVETFNSSYPLFTSILFFSFIYFTFLNAKDAVSLITVGSFMAFIIAFNKFLFDSQRLSLAVISSLKVIPLYERVKPILESEPESTELSLDPGELVGEIEMNAVCFRYHEELPMVLKDISFKIMPGEMVAFVGPSGSGKSTIMRLLLGFEHPEAGSIFYDGGAFDSMNKELVRRQIGVVLQNGSLMSGSIFQNIVGNSELTLDDAWDAARMAGIEEDIKQMPMAMHTLVNESGSTFSGGQRQRLMIARAIAHKPRLLFMDEATSALDNRTQNIVSESLERLQATRIVIAHRLSTIINANRIIVMDKGQIVESGTYKELMEQEGLFKQLADREMT